MAGSNSRMAESGCGHAWLGVQPMPTRAGQQDSGHGHKVSQATRDVGMRGSSGWQQYREPVTNVTLGVVTASLGPNSRTVCLHEF